MPCVSDSLPSWSGITFRRPQILVGEMSERNLMHSNIWFLGERCEFIDAHAPEPGYHFTLASSRIEGECEDHQGFKAKGKGLVPTESPSETGNRRLRLGMVGGGPGSFIGAVHRIAARMDDRYELFAAALSSDPEKSLAAAKGLQVPRAYGSF